MEIKKTAEIFLAFFELFWENVLYLRGFSLCKNALGFTRALEFCVL